MYSSTLLFLLLSPLALLVHADAATCCVLELSHPDPTLPYTLTGKTSGKASGCCENPGGGTWDNAAQTCNFSNAGFNYKNCCNANTNTIYCEGPGGCGSKVVAGNCHKLGINRSTNKNPNKAKPEAISNKGQGHSDNQGLKTNGNHKPEKGSYKNGGKGGA